VSRIGVAIVDDEPLALELLREFVAADRRFEVVCECGGGAAAIEAIDTLRPEVVLLDVQMPEVDGFDVLTRLAAPLPVVVMVTAYHEHAVRAFDHHALDYVLKPIERARLQLALDRAFARVQERRAGSAAPGGEHRLRASLSGAASGEQRIALKASGTLLFLEREQLHWVESAGNYLKVECDGRTHLVRDSLPSLLERLGEAFVRVHRSFVINAASVVEVRVQPGGSDYAVLLRDGREVPIGRSYRRSVLARLSRSE